MKVGTLVKFGMFQFPRGFNGLTPNAIYLIIEIDEDCAYLFNITDNKMPTSGWYFDRFEEVK